MWSLADAAAGGASFNPAGLLFSGLKFGLNRIGGSFEQRQRRYERLMREWWAQATPEQQAEELYRQRQAEWDQLPFQEEYGYDMGRWMQENYGDNPIALSDGRLRGALSVIPPGLGPRAPETRVGDAIPEDGIIREDVAVHDPSPIGEGGGGTPTFRGGVTVQTGGQVPVHDWGVKFDAEALLGTAEGTAGTGGTGDTGGGVTPDVREDPPVYRREDPPVFRGGVTLPQPAYAPANVNTNTNTNTVSPTFNNVFQPSIGQGSQPNNARTVLDWVQGFFG